MLPQRAASGSSQEGWHESDKYKDVYFYESTSRWVAWVREPRVGGGPVFIGSYLTEKSGARCQDRALLKLEMDSSMTQPIKLNFDREDYQEDEHLRNTLTTEGFIDLLLRESRQSHNKFKQTADERAPSESDLALIADLTVWHQMPYLSARRLTQLNCERWPVWCPDRIEHIAEARRADYSRDWYFPLIVTKDQPRARTWSTWSGIWHSAADQASEGIHALPPLAHLPHEGVRFSSFDDILAASRGLLLIKIDPWCVLAASNRTSTTTRASTTSTGRSNFEAPKIERPKTDNLQSVVFRVRNPLFRNWARLVVCNPLTKEWRVLPAAADDIDDAGARAGRDLLDRVWNILGSLSGVQAQMVVDDAANSYKVILTLKSVVCVYSSTCDSWTCLRFPTPRPWDRPSLFDPLEDEMNPGMGAHVAGRLYFADVIAARGAGANGNADTAPILRAARAGNLRLFEVEAEAGTWTLLHTFKIRKVHQPRLSRRGWKYGLGLSQLVELVECMQDLYVVIPARLDEVLTTRRKQSRRWKLQVLAWKNEKGAELESMPLVFYIVRLQRAGEDNGVLRIQIPKTRSDLRSRRWSLYTKTDPSMPWDENWFTCTARKSVIWVACDDYLLQYNVVSGESKTHIIPLNESTDDATLVRFSYTPSFHMKP